MSDHSEPLPYRFRLRLELARWNHLSALKRLTRVLADEGGDRALAEAQLFGALAQSLVENTQRDLPFWRIEQRLFGLAR